MSPQPYPTPTRRLLAEVNTLRNCEPPIAYVPPGPEGGYSVVGLTPEGREWAGIAAAGGAA